MNIRRKDSHRQAPPSWTAPLRPHNLVPQRSSASNFESASRRILIMRLGSYGDILMGTPLLAALRAHWPDAHITWMAEYSEREAIDANPYIDEVLLWHSSYFRRLAKLQHWAMGVLRRRQLRAQLRRHHYDIFISFQPEEWAWLHHGVDASIRIGVFDTFRQFKDSHATSPNTKYYTHPYTFDDLPLHRTDQYLLPLKALGIPALADKKMSMGFTVEDDAAVTKYLAERGVASGEPLAVLAPMTTWPSRCWDGDRYAELGDALAAQGLRVVLIGSPRRQETEIVGQIAAQMRVPPVEALGTLSFRQMAALIARASILISGDTGPMHVAAAVDTPFLSLFGPTPVQGRVPLSGRGLTLMHPVPCGPCDQSHCKNVGKDYMLCMRLITVEETLHAANQILRREVAAR